MIDPELYYAYCCFMNEYLSLGHMRITDKPGKNFIPHHAVVKRENGNMKIWVVFSASAQNYRVSLLTYYFKAIFSSTYSLPTLRI